MHRTFKKNLKSTANTVAFFEKTKSALAGCGLGWRYSIDRGSLSA